MGLKNLLIAASAATMYVGAAQAATVNLTNGMTTAFNAGDTLVGQDTILGPSGPGSVQYDIIASSDALINSSAVTLEFIGNFSDFAARIFTGPNVYVGTLISSSVVSSTFSFAEFILPANETASVMGLYGAVNGDAAQVNYQMATAPVAVSAVPLPAGGLLLLSAFGAMAVTRRKKA